MRRRIQIAICTGALILCTPLMQGAEHVTLTNGFAMDCNHHAVVDGQMRLYLSAGESNYIVLKPEELTGVEIVPDPPPVPFLTSPEPENRSRLTAADLHEMLAGAGQTHNLDVDLLASVVKAESNGNARAVSKAGAQGLMQLMPATATGLGVPDSFAPADNVRGGSAYLDTLLTRYHENLGLALAAYNAGPAAVDKYHGIPPYHETRVYVARVIHEFNRRVETREAQARHLNAESRGSK
ncbi:MAG TPA: lytic transglycosylase domain-containing protein [Terracidiphilus sp.]|nr:lytic transglycosylase domain-containing protein [Terracidiphilus sp.]